MGARTASKANDAINSINNQLNDNVEIEHLPLDLTSLPSIKAAADKVNRDTKQLDVLILNAGIMAVPAEKTEAGFDIQLGTNHVGHHLLTKLLMSTLEETVKAGRDVRVLSLSSEAFQLGPGLQTITSPERLSKQSDWSRYGASKAANIMFAAELARRHPQLTSVSLHPGIIMTDLHAASSQKFTMVGMAMKLVSPFIAQDVPHGAFNSLWLAAGAKKEELKNGGYYTPVGNLKASNKWSKDAAAGTTLWEWTEAQLAKSGY